MRDAATHWRDASRNPKFFMLEAPAAFPLVIFLLHIRWWSFFLAIGATLFFGVLSHFKFRYLNVGYCQS